MLSQKFLHVCSILSIYAFSLDWFIYHLHKRTHLHSTVHPQQRARVHSLLGHKFVQGETIFKFQISGQGHMYKPHQICLHLGSSSKMIPRTWFLYNRFNILMAVISKSHKWLKTALWALLSLWYSWSKNSLGSGGWFTFLIECYSCVKRVIRIRTNPVKVLFTVTKNKITWVESTKSLSS